MTTRPTPEKAAREQVAENRKKAREKKARDRRLYRVGQVMESHGYEDPEKVDELMKTIDETLAYAERGRDSEASLNRPVERAIEEEERLLARRRETDDPCPDYRLDSMWASRWQTSAPAARSRLVAAVVGGVLLGVVLHALWRSGR